MANICMIQALFLCFYSQGSLAFNSTKIIDGNSTIMCIDTNQVLKIVSIYSIQRLMKCIDRIETRTISNQTIRRVGDHCNGHQMCYINRTLMSAEETYLSQKGYFDLAYNCRFNQVKNCNFDDELGHVWCNFTRLGEKDGFIWRRKSKFNFLRSDHTHPNTPSKGKFAYILHRRKASLNATTTMMMELKNRSIKDRCLVFWYVITDTKHRMEVQFNGETKHTMSGGQKIWTQKMIYVSERIHNITFLVSRNGVTFDGQIAIDDLSISDIDCKYMTLQDDMCTPLSNIDDKLETCGEPENLTISFDPIVQTCTDVYSFIKESFYNTCYTSKPHSKCVFDLSTIVEMKSMCFWQDEVIVEYDCLDLMDPWLNINNESPKISLGTFGVVASLVCILISVAAFISIRRRGKRRNANLIIKDQTFEDYMGHQCINLTKHQSSNDTNQIHINQTAETTFIDSNTDYDYATSGFKQTNRNSRNDIDNFLEFNRDTEDRDNISIDEYTIEKVNFLLEKSSPDYEMSNPEVENDIHGTNFAVSGHSKSNTHTYGHSKDKMYDSTEHARDRYDHFTGLKTDDDYDISRK